MTGLIVHEWIEQHGGSEKVVDAMLQTYPDADIFCLWNNAPRRYPKTRVIESRLSKTPIKGKKALSVPFMTSTWRSARVEAYDWVLVSSHVFAHHIATNKKLLHTPVYAYIHSPARYIWEPELDGRGQNIVAKATSPYFRIVDKYAAAHGQVFAANSYFVRDRIRRVWGQDAKVIYPPVEVKKLQSQESWVSSLNETETMLLESLPDSFILGASRFIEYKRLSDVIHAGEACGAPVVLAGSGPSIGALREQARQSNVPVTIIEKPSDGLLYALYEKSMLFVFPSVEDFGIMPVEAMALGTPVLVNSTGGASESVNLIAGGVAVDDWGSAAVKAAIDEALSLDMKAAQIRSEQFSEEAFDRNIKLWML